MLQVPFLTDLDSRAQVKGTRDALGIQMIWTRLGRHVVGNLSTVAVSVRDYTTTLLGYYFAECIAQDVAGDDLATFLKFEQLAGYVRAQVNEDTTLRGTERVQRRLAESRKVILSADTAHQILSNQKIYGLWGLYTVPSRASGLLTDPPTRLTPPARELVETLYLPRLTAAAGRGAKGLIDILRPTRSTVDLEGRHRAIADALAGVLSRKIGPQELGVYRRHLVCGGLEDSTHGRQRQLAVLLDATLDDQTFFWSAGTVQGLAKAAHKKGEEWHDLERYLTRIRVAEQVLGPGAMLFSYLLGTGGRSLETIASRLRNEWKDGLRTVDAKSFSQLRDEISEVDREGADRWVSIAEGLAGGDYGEVIRLLAQQNAAVMKSRGGVPWFELRGDRIEVRYRDERASLPSRADIPHLWRFPYFLNSLRTVLITCRGSGVRS